MRTEKRAFSVSWASWNRAKCPEIVLKFSKNWVRRFHFLLLGALIQGLPIFFEYPLLSQERVKLRTSTFVRTFLVSIETKVYYKFLEN